VSCCHGHRNKTEMGPFVHMAHMVQRGRSMSMDEDMIVPYGKFGRKRMVEVLVMRRDQCPFHTSIGMQLARCLEAGYSQDIAMLEVLDLPRFHFDSVMLAGYFWMTIS
jgi:hypothetical protein